MADALKRLARLQPDKLAVVMADGSASLSYAELDRRADRLAALLQHMGLREGDTFALLHDNETRVLELWWGARRAGLYYAPMSVQLTADELAYIVRDCGARAVVATAGRATAAAELKRSLQDPSVAFLTTGAACAEVESLDARLEAADAEPQQVQQIGRELIYSSGTTGRPRGIRRPLAAAASADDLPPLERRIRAVFAIAPDTIYLSVSPLYHATGRFLNRVVETGGTAVILPKFAPEQALAAIARHSVTHTQWVPTMFVRLLALPEEERRYHDLSSHRVALHAAAPCPIPIKRAMIDWWGPILTEYYGGAENAGVTTISSDEWIERPGSVGRSISGAIHILDEAGGHGDLPDGEIGLICFEGGVPFAYMNAPEPSAEGPLGYAGYGDLGHLDTEGYLYISDRRTDLIITGGVNVYPKEIELVLEDHPAVVEAAVIGMADPEFGQQVKAVVRLAAPETASLELAEALIAFCRARLSSIKLPRSVDFVEALPRSEHGKLLKRELRARYTAAGQADAGGD